MIPFVGLLCLYEPLFFALGSLGPSTTATFKINMLHETQNWNFVSPNNFSVADSLFHKYLIHTLTFIWIICFIPIGMSFSIPQNSHKLLLYLIRGYAKYLNNDSYLTTAISIRSPFFTTHMRKEGDIILLKFRGILQLSVNQISLKYIHGPTGEVNWDS